MPAAHLGARGASCALPPGPSGARESNAQRSGEPRAPTAHRLWSHSRGAVKRKRTGPVLQTTSGLILENEQNLRPYALKSVRMLLPPFGQGEKWAWLQLWPTRACGKIQHPAQFKAKKSAVCCFPSSAGFFFPLTSSATSFHNDSQRNFRSEILEGTTHSLIITSCHMTTDTVPCLDSTRQSQ